MKVKTKKNKKKIVKHLTIRCDENCPNHGDGMNDEQRSAQKRFTNNDSLGGETGRYLDSIRGTCDDPGE